MEPQLKKRNEPLMKAETIIGLKIPSYGALCVINETLLLNHDVV